MPLMRRTNGFHPLDQLRTQMDRLVSDFFGPGTYAPRALGAQASFPALNVWEYGDHLYAEAELPGLQSENLDVTVVGGDLTIRGRRGEATDEGTTYHRRERGAGEFTRVVRLPIEVDADRVEATLKDGVLLVKLPKAESAKPKKIKVSAG
ncbi:MAG: Hsp20/alpha crystallin family protein [Pirellulales bacterium]